MESFDRMFATASRDLDAGLQHVIYYAIFIDVVLLISLSVFIWCCWVYASNYKRIVDENIRFNRTKRQYYGAKAERERLEVKRLNLELGLVESVVESERGLYGE